MQRAVNKIDARRNHNMGASLALSLGKGIVKEWFAIADGVAGLTCFFDLNDKLRFGRLLYFYQYVIASLLPAFLCYFLCQCPMASNK